MTVNYSIVRNRKGRQVILVENAKMKMQILRKGLKVMFGKKYERLHYANELGVMFNDMASRTRKEGLRRIPFELNLIAVDCTLVAVTSNVFGRLKKEIDLLQVLNQLIVCKI